MTPAEQLKALRLKKEITPTERIEAESGLSAWESSILSADKSLSRKQGQTLDHGGSIDLHTLPTTTGTKNLPPVRGASAPLEVSGTKTEISSECEGVINRKRLSGRIVILEADILIIMVTLIAAVSFRIGFNQFYFLLHWHT